MPRKLENWLDTYMEFTEHTESATVFHRWVGISVLAAVLRKKTWLTFGRLRIYPNMYIVLVANPGIARKTQAISYGSKLLNEVPNIHTSADSITREALIKDIEDATEGEQMIDGTTFSHASVTAICREFESFLGQKKENTKMLVFLTDLFDCEELPWKYRTKNAGSSIAPAVFFNLLGATTPDSLASMFPVSAIGGGLASRILFIWAGGKAKKVAIPTMSARTAALKDPLLHDLNVISRITGAYEFTPDCERKWNDWYNSFDEMSPRRLCKDPTFDGWYSRKPLYLLKTATIMSAAERDEKRLEWEHVEKAKAFIESIEIHMGKAFASVGRSDVTSDVDQVMSIVKQRGVIPEKELLQMVWRNIDSRKFDNVMSTAKRSGAIRCLYHDEKGNRGIWYQWVGGN